MKFNERYNYDYKKDRRHRKGGFIMASVNIKIGGMSCQHCVASVGKAITSVGGIKKVDISIGSAYVEYDDSKTTLEQIEKAIENEGYKIIK